MSAEAGAGRQERGGGGGGGGYDPPSLFTAMLTHNKYMYTGSMYGSHDLRQEMEASLVRRVSPILGGPGDEAGVQ